MRLNLFLVLFLVYGFSFGQDSYPKTYFINPLEIPLSLSGNFGELRDNHFHSGLDIRTQGRKGLKVFATADGYISRMNMGLYGYGNVLYIQHPNGFSTVYGHLDEFAPKIRKHIREKQYQLKRNTLELFPKKDEIPVKKGELIAYSGNSGGSGGPHLHYEIRDDQQRPLNPLLFGIEVKDTRPPKIEKLNVYPQNENSHINSSANRQELHFTKIDENTYQTKPIEAFGKIGFGIGATDFMDGASFTYGIYKINTYLNRENQLSIKFDKFSFANTRYINRYIDYDFYKDKKYRVQKLFIEPNNFVDMQIDAPQNGFINIEEDLDYKFEVVLEDFAGNKTTLFIPIKGKKIAAENLKQKEEKTTDYIAEWNKPNVFNLENHDIFIPKGALYEDTYLEIEENLEEIKVHKFTTPLHKNITIGFDASKYNKEDLEKLYVARTFPWGKKYYSNTYKEGNRITTKTRTFGTFQLEMDLTPPTVEPVNFRDKKWVSNLDFLELKIKDEESGIESYYGTINGKFIVLEYDYKTDIIKYDFRDKVSNETENNLKIIVVDKVGNSTTYEATFFRKE